MPASAGNHQAPDEHFGATGCPAGTEIISSAVRWRKERACSSFAGTGSAE